MDMPLHNSSIILSLSASVPAIWERNLAAVSSLQISQAALFIDRSKGDRRELYRQLEATHLQSIPYVHLPADIQEREVRYLAAKYHTKIFAFAVRDAAYPVITAMASEGLSFLIANPATKGDMKLFNDEAFAHPGVAGVAFDTGAFEQGRLRDDKQQQAVLEMLDKRPIMCTVIPPFDESWYAALFRSKNNRLTSLAQLRYLTHISQNYFKPLYILKLDNLLEEQIEVQHYIASFLEKHV